MPKNLLIITQRVDEQDDLLGFFVDWIREFSLHFEKVFVITLAKGKYQLPNNVFVYSLGKESNNSTIARIYNFYKYLFQLVPKSSNIFAHMSPIFVIASWPITRFYRKKIILWYLHRSVTGRLKLAERLVYKIATAAKESLRLNSDKIMEVGHGINVDKFTTIPDKRYEDLKILTVGRISPIKDLVTYIETGKILQARQLPFHMEIVGRPIMSGDHEYLKRLTTLVTKYQLEQWVQFTGFVPYSKIEEKYASANVLINLAPTGGIDKTVLEAMATGCITFVCNQAFRKYFGDYADQLIFTHGRAEDLANKLEKYHSKSIEEKRAMAEFLQAQAHTHSIPVVIDKIINLFS